MGEGLSLPLTFATLRAFKDAGILPSSLVRPNTLVDEVAAVLTLKVVAKLCGKDLSEDAIVASEKMSVLRGKATETHVALVMMFGPEETPADPKGGPPAASP